MRTNYKHILIGVSLISLTTSCEDFLDKSPDMGLTEQDVFSKYESARGYLDNTYLYLDNIYKFGANANGRTHIGAISDEFASLYNFAESIPVNSGNWLSQNITSFEIGVNKGTGDDFGFNGSTTIWKAYQSIRIANRTIQKVEEVPGMTETQKNELLGQAYFMRAWYYFQLIKRYGGMPILDQAFIGDGSEDLPRKTYHESSDWMVSDLDKAIELLPDQWDTNNTGRATKLAAMALKSMAQLYDASPLMQNDLTKTVVMDYDQERAKIAAQSAYKVIKYIENEGSQWYELTGSDIPMEDLEAKAEAYKHIFYWSAPPFTQKEYIWYNRTQDDLNSYNYSRYIRSFWLPSEWSKGTGNDAVVYNAPTQNMVDLFEKQSGGVYYPKDDPNANYNPQSPYTDRDPRFTNNILYPGEEWGVNNNGAKEYVTTYKNGQMYNTVLTNNQSNKRQQTGYLCKKYLWPECNQYTLGYNLYRTITVYIRTAQIYLDFAEAAFEAMKSAKTPIEGCDGWTAEMAINKVRNRVGVTNLPDYIVSDEQKFREAYRRERAVELMFEDHRWWDIRRWMIAHELFKDQYPIKNMLATKNGNTYTYEIQDNTKEQRVFTMRNYWYPFSMNDVSGLNNLVQNPGW